MPDFFDTMVDKMDKAVFTALHDTALLDSRAVQGMYVAPWLQPDLGGYRTGLLEPWLDVLDTDAATAAPGSSVECHGRLHSVVTVEPQGTGITRLVLRVEPTP